MGISESGNILRKLEAGKRKPRVIVIGTGLSGICMGMRLRDFTGLYNMKMPARSAASCQMLTLK